MDEESKAEGVSDTSPKVPPFAPEPTRRQAMTRQMRRFLGPARSWYDRAVSEQPLAEHAAPPSIPAAALQIPAQKQLKPATEAFSAQETIKTTGKKLKRRRKSTGRTSRALEMGRIVLIVGAAAVLASTFYLGTKARYLKNAIASHNKSNLLAHEPNKFTGFSADELVEQALAAERLGKWREAVQKFIAAKQKDLSYRGVLFRAGKLCYDHEEFDGADKLLERAISFGDHSDAANYLRGLIAIGRGNLTAAERFFEAAATAEPFTPGYYYYWAEALRRDYQPQEAIHRYEQAAARSSNEQDATLCKFKSRIATLETSDNSQLKLDIEQKRAASGLSTDWLLTDAALKIRAGNIAEAVQLIEQARKRDQDPSSSLFVSCVADMLFIEAGRHHHEIGEACRIENRSKARTP